MVKQICSLPWFSKFESKGQHLGEFSWMHQDNSSEKRFSIDRHVSWLKDTLTFQITKKKIVEKTGNVNVKPEIMSATQIGYRSSIWKGNNNVLKLRQNVGNGNSYTGKCDVETWNPLGYKFILSSTTT